MTRTTDEAGRLIEGMKPRQGLSGAQLCAVMGSHMWRAHDDETVWCIECGAKEKVAKRISDEVLIYAECVKILGDNLKIIERRLWEFVSNRKRMTLEEQESIWSMVRNALHEGQPK